MVGLSGARVLVVGASSGIGRAAAVAAARQGATVTFAARRAGQLADAVAEAGTGHVVLADTTRADECERLVDEAFTAMGGIDVILYATGVAPLARLADLGADGWSAVLATNLVGANSIIRAAVPHLGTGAIVAAISSESVVAPRPGLVAYAASKAALETSIAGWRAEHPRIRFGIITVGSTVPTDFGRDFDGAVLGALFEDWMRLGMLQEGFMETSSVGAVIADVLGAVWPHASVGLEHVVLRPPFPVVGAVAQVQDAAIANEIA
jgi:NAD(P)-dependent dehydrogenase (short-subunit alcohol dehydrogenase family)